LNFTIWYILVGALLIVMALSSSVLARLPLTTSILYLAVGVALGPAGFALIRLDTISSARLLERLSEVAVTVSLFTAGLKLSTPLSEPRWWLPIRLAFLSMLVTVGLVTLAGVWLLKLPLGVAVLLGAIIAPTDPVLASDVQVEHPWDRDRLRFSLTGEAGLNDGAAFPFVMLGLGLLGLRDLGRSAWRWWTIDVLWAIIAGLLIGAATGYLVGKLVVHLRIKRKESTGLDDFLSLGLLASSYGLALLVHAYGFLAVFAAGLALRRVESRSHADDAPPQLTVPLPTPPGQRPEIDPQHVPAYMAQAVLGFNQQLERICELALVLLVGGLLTRAYLPSQALWFVPLLLLVIRPAAVLLGLLGAKADRIQRSMICWFGIRGVGSVYYLSFAISKGLPHDHARLLAALTLSTILCSIILHGVSVTPLMKLYERLRRRR
jgi:NhaP-type Na+/H+ or K+/H+ antiporter